MFLDFFVLFDYLLDLQVAMKNKRIGAMDFGSCLVFCGFLDFLFRVSFSYGFISFGISVTLHWADVDNEEGVVVLVMGFDTL